MALPHVCIPIDLDAFVLNRRVCDASSQADDQGIALVAPITQPNYVNLRLTSDQIQHDILPRVDVHNSKNAATNPRIAELYAKPFVNFTTTNPIPDSNASAGIVRSRQGVYLHWSLPRLYRAAATQAKPPVSAPGDAKSSSSPVYPQVPNRWLVVRIITKCSPPDAIKEPVTAWVIESDRLRTIDDLKKDDNNLPIDIETDVAPFVAWSDDSAANPDVLTSQAEKFIGIRTPLSSWTEPTLKPDQRVRLTVMNSSNPMFADYTACNANVFSTKDNFFYDFDKNNNPLFLDSATCDYVVLGWHSDAGIDPLGGAGVKELGSRIASLMCTPPIADGANKSIDSTRLLDTGSTRLICHGARYNVTYSSSDLPPKIPANDYARNFTKGVDMEPVSIGSTALDAALAFFNAHKDDSLAESLFETGGAQTAKALMGVQELLYATEDDYDSRIKAADLVFTHNFARSQAGSVWRYDKKKEDSGAPIAPSTKKPDASTDSSPFALMSETELIVAINEYQRMLDAASLQLDQLRSALFSEWFKYLSDPTSSDNHLQSGSRLQMYTTRIPLLRIEASRLVATIKDIQQNKIAKIVSYVAVKKVAQDSFFRRSDPTLCLAGIDAGWDPLFLKDTPTRFSDRLQQPGSGSGRPDISKCVSLLANSAKFSTTANDPMNSALSKTLIDLLREASKGIDRATPIPGHQVWTGQPFKPQFVEWEGVYHHIDWSIDNWDIRLVNSALSDSNHPQVSYVNPVDLTTLNAARDDRRPVSGRMLVLPQPSFALDAVLAQVLDGTPVNQLPQSLQDQQARDDLRHRAKSLKFISGELEGLTDALLTMSKGQHVQPNLGTLGVGMAPMAVAITAAKDISMTRSDFELIGGASGRTPYGTLFNFDATDVTSKPFKPVQHGQFGKY